MHNSGQDMAPWLDKMPRLWYNKNRCKAIIEVHVTRRHHRAADALRGGIVEVERGRSETIQASMSPRSDRATSIPRVAVSALLRFESFSP